MQSSKDIESDDDDDDDYVVKDDVPGRKFFYDQGARSKRFEESMKSS